MFYQINIRYIRTKQDEVTIKLKFKLKELKDSEDLELKLRIGGKSMPTAHKLAID
jgi:hypothetical protein